VHVTSGGNPVDSARVCLQKTGEEYEVVLTNSNGDALMHVRPETAGSAFLTVTGTNGGAYRPFEGTLTFTAPSGAVLVSRAADRTIDDDILGGTQGANDGGADAGETIDWRLPLRNNGNVTANPVSASLSTTDPRASITIASSAYGSIGAGATSNGTPYRIILDENIPDGTEIPFRLDIIAGSLHWVDEFRLAVRAPTLVHIANTITDNGSNGTIGNGNGRLDVGETVDFAVTLRNVTQGVASNLIATLSTSSPGVSITNPNATLGTLAPGAAGTSTPFRIVSTSSSNPALLLTVSDFTGARYTRTIDLLQPVGIVGLVGTGAGEHDHARLEEDVEPRRLSATTSTARATRGGPYSQVNLTPHGPHRVLRRRRPAGPDRFYYQISAVDSSGNESALSTVSSASTNPPLPRELPAADRAQHAVVALRSRTSTTRTTPPRDRRRRERACTPGMPNGTALLDADGLGAHLG
jgi:hypothetical protein